MMQALKVVSSNKTKNGTYCNKLTGNINVAISGSLAGVQDVKKTFYVFTSAPNKGIVEIDLNQWRQIPKSFTIINDDGDEEDIELTYLIPKIN